MWLLIDAGNTRIKCLILEGAASKAEINFASTGYALEMNSWLMDLEGVNRILVSSVIGKEFEIWLTRRCKGLGLVAPEFPKTATMSLGISVTYEYPSQFGVDRYLAMVAAYELVKGGVQVVDCGTAVTVDAVDEKGRHQGGVIMPGIEMMKHALIKNTKGINEIDAEEISVFSHTTSSGVSSGSLLAVVGGIREVLDRQSDFMTAEAQCVITGGSAELVAEYLGLPCRVCHNLVFDGLKMFAKQ